jgi:HNH endonuclease
MARIFVVHHNPDNTRYDYPADPSDAIGSARAMLANGDQRWVAGNCRRLIKRGDVVLFKFGGRRLNQEPGIYAAAHALEPPVRARDRVWTFGYRMDAVLTRLLVERPIVGPELARIVPRSFGAGVQLVGEAGRAAFARHTKQGGGFDSRKLGSRLADWCVYTIATPERLAAAENESQALTERTKWATAARLYDTACDQATPVAILFADSRDCSELIAWSVLREVALTAQGTSYFIGPLYGIRGHAPQELTKLSDGARIKPDYIRPYVPCETPEFLFALAKRPKAWDAPGRLEAREGEKRLRLHYEAERDRRIVAEAKQRALRIFGCLVCEVCRFDFASTYGEIGDGFIEAHHRRPLSDYPIRGDVTLVEDLALVCANCHRMLHQKDDMSVEKLSAALSKE